MALAERLGNPYNLAFAFDFAAMVHRHRGEIDRAAACAQRALTYSADHELSDALMFAAALQGWSLCRAGAISEGIAFVRKRRRQGVPTSCLLRSSPSSQSRQARRPPD